MNPDFSLDVISKEDEVESPSSLRNSGDFGSVGCLPCTPTPTRKTGKKTNKVDSAPCPSPPTQAGNRHDSAALSGNNWCCGVVVASPRKSKARDKLQ